ncbi:MAG: molybdenum ABC transporter ATP-binding protein [Pseudomonadota bacterium]
MSLSVRLNHRFPGFTLDAAFEAPEGVTALFGKSGSGKTTVVNAVAGLLKPDAGAVTVNGRILLDTGQGLHMPTPKRRVGYVFQDARLFPHMSVARNLTYGRWWGGAPSKSDTTRITDLLGIGHLMDRTPVALSGGETQRVAIGRALLARPDLLLLDEPLAALDAPRKDEILPYLERLRSEARIPILYVSHSVAEVARLATTVIVLEDGKVVRTGPATDVLSDPKAVSQLGVRDAGAVLQARVRHHHDDGLSELETSAGRLFLPKVDAQIGATLRVRIQAQDVILSRTRPEGLSALNILPGTVTSLLKGDGPGVLVQMSSGTDQVLARVTRRSAQTLELAEGATCYAVVKTVSVARADIGSDRTADQRSRV